ncbi:hypothetical protein MMC07_007200 [Pseudocyphellaria aurata]|nr:hypothetical protein [Pseudocyphellaria aurata]
MPTYRSITISLVSQFDIMTIPEYAPPTAPKKSSSALPVLVNPDLSVVSVYIPTYPSSQFWISYSISPPHPPKALYYFKLFLHGSCVVSWGCGEEDGHKGRTMFAMFNSSEMHMGNPLLERRALSFGTEAVSVADANYMEIRVYRSKERTRIEPQVQDFQGLSVPGVKTSVPPDDENGIHLTQAGLVPSDHPQRYYSYVLLDSLNRPFATFRYYYRSWEQLGALGVISIPSKLTEPVEPNPSTEPPAAPIPNESKSDSPTHDSDPPTPPPKSPRNKCKPTPYRSTPVLVSALKSRSRSLPSSSPTRSLFSSLTRRSPSPTKRPASPSPACRGRKAELGSPTRSSNNSSSFGRSVSLGVLKGVVNNAVKRRARGVVMADDGDTQRVPWTDRSTDEVLQRRRLSGIDGSEEKDVEGDEDGQGGEDQRRRRRGR